MCPSRLPSPACSPRLCSPQGTSLCSLGWSGIYVHVASLCFSRVLFTFVSLKPELVEVEGLVYWKEPRWRELTQPCTSCARHLIFQSLSFLIRNTDRTMLPCVVENGGGHYQPYV